MDIRKRLASRSKPDFKLSARKGGDIDLVKMKAKKVKQFKKKPIGKNERVVNNATIPPRMIPSIASRMKFRQEMPQNSIKEPQKEKFNLQFVGSKLPDDPKPEKLPPHKNKFVRVANNIFRNEESVLDQSDRLIHSRSVKRELANKLNGIQIGQDKKIAELIKSAHIAEKNVIAEDEKQFMSEFTGPTKTLIKDPEIKQELDQNMNILKRARPSLEQQKFKKGIEDFADKFGINRDLVKGFAKGFVPSPRQQAILQREKQ